MQKSYTLFSDSLFSDEFTNCVRNREIEQKFFYEWDIAEQYYKTSLTTKFIKEWWSSYGNYIYDLWKKNCIKEWEKTILIWLWCGASKNEAMFLKRLHKELPWEYAIDYLGVDASEDMLRLSMKEMEDIDWCKKEFMRADFWKKDFKNEVSRIKNDYDRTIFTFFWNTLWNINHPNIMSVLYDILDKWDKIWLTVSMRNWNSKNDIFKLAEYYKNYVLTNEVWMKQYFDTLENIGVSYDSWEMNLYSSVEKSINAQKIHFFFEFRKETEVKTRGGEMSLFFPWDRIYLMKIHKYNRDGLVNFFEKYRFKFIDESYITTDYFWQWQFIFEKE